MPPAEGLLGLLRQEMREDAQRTAGRLVAAAAREKRVLLGKDQRQSCFQILDLCITNTIQAFQGFFGPVGSKRSRHSLYPGTAFSHLGVTQTGTRLPKG